ncbi:MAG: glycosyltransferase family 4 protein [Nitrospira sp.]|nr:glycosyltransferase family 4 protein [Nitrospira sp.]
MDELRGLGVEVTTYPEYSIHQASPTCSRSGQNRQLSRFFKSYSPNWLQHVFIEFMSIARGLWYSFRLGLWAKQFKSHPPDVIYGRVSYCDWAPWLIGHTLCRPIILEVHSPHYLERTFRGWKQSRILQKYEQLQWKYASLIRVVSKPMVKILEREGITPERISFIPYGVEILPQRVKDPSCHSSNLTIVFVGSFYSWHGVRILLEAVALVKQHIPDLTLELIGDGQTFHGDKQLTRILGLEDIVRFLGWLPRHKMLDHVRFADIAVAPFLHIEPFYFDPVKILDYMSTGVAIIASRLERIAEMLHYGRGGILVPPGNAQVLADNLVILAKNSHLREQLGIAAQEILEEEGYSWESTAQRVKGLCQEAIEHKGPPFSEVDASG